MRIRHVVIREASIQQFPKPHVVYHIDVITQNDRWSVSRRYSDFLSLQLQMLQIDPSSKDLIPGKRVFGNLSPALIESRRQALERYLQRLVISDKAVFSDALMKFMDANEHNAVWVTQRLVCNVHFCCSYWWIDTLGDGLCKQGHFSCDFIVWVRHISKSEVLNFT